MRDKPAHAATPASGTGTACRAPTRVSIRLPGYDYSREGAYFITICTYNREWLFGEIDQGEMRLNINGNIVQKIWIETPTHFPHITMGEFVVMPNHMHGIILINEPVAARVGARHAVPLHPADPDSMVKSVPLHPFDPDTAAQSVPLHPFDPDTAAQSVPQHPSDPDTAAQSVPQHPFDPDTAAQSVPQHLSDPDTASQTVSQHPFDPDTAVQKSDDIHAGKSNTHPQQEQFGKPTIGTIPTIVRSFKSAVTKRINEQRAPIHEPVWQRNYWEHVIRDEKSFEKISTYIVNNPANWELDKLFPGEKP
jgi:REP element-mobilizing transposase RayT